MACPSSVSNHINSITSEGIIMRLITCLTSDENVYNYAVLEKMKTTTRLSILSVRS